MKVSLVVKPAGLLITNRKIKGRSGITPIILKAINVVIALNIGFSSSTFDITIFSFIRTSTQIFRLETIIFVIVSNNSSLKPFLHKCLLFQIFWTRADLELPYSVYGALFLYILFLILWINNYPWPLKTHRQKGSQILIL